MQINLNQEALWAIIEQAHTDAAEIKANGALDQKQLDLAAMFYGLAGSARAIIIHWQEEELENQKKHLQEELQAAR